MTFVNDGANTHDIISATGGAAQQSFGDSVVNFKPGDSLLVLGFGAGSQNSPLPLPPGVTETDFGTASSELNIDFNGGTTPRDMSYLRTFRYSSLRLPIMYQLELIHGYPSSCLPSQNPSPRGHSR